MDFKNYENNMPHPTRFDFTTRFWYSCGACVAKKVAGEEMVMYADNVDLDKCVIESVIDQVNYSHALEKHREHVQALKNKFKNDLFEDLGIEDNPRREKLFAKAWESADSGGFEAVYTTAESLVDLIQD